ncbi:MAG TPA: DUF1552 domain-containing protein [Polyangiaceae bacterium]|jgi:hypothetical protein|nr:DUF1552 domain-containing protein [Polyangiaceae bacterium]
MPTRRQFLTSAGAGLLLAPFINAGLRREAKAASSTSKRLLVFCSMGTYPPLWTPTVSGETISSWSAMTQPLSAAADNIVLVEGMPSGNPNDGHGSSDSLTGQGFGYYAVNNVPIVKLSVDQFVANNLVQAGVNRPIASLLLGANCNENGGLSQFYGGPNGGNLPTIGSPLSAYNTVFGAAMPSGSAMSAQALLARRQSILDTVTGEITGLQSTLGSNEKAKLDAHLDSIRQLENKLMASSGVSSCTKPATPGADSTFQYMGDMDAMAANLIHQQIIVSAFGCDITRVACLEYGNDQKLMVNAMGLPYDDQHGGYIHSGASSNYANLVLFEAYLATQFVSIINALKAVPDPLGTNGQTLFDNTLMIWARDMGDAQNHNQQSMRFVLASGNGGYLKTATGGRYVNSTERHERILLNVCEAMGISSYTGFGDPMLPTKEPLPDISA